MKTKREIEDQMIYIQKLLDMEANYDYDYYYEDIQNKQFSCRFVGTVCNHGYFLINSCTGPRTGTYPDTTQA